MKKQIFVAMTAAAMVMGTLAGCGQSARVEPTAPAAPSAAASTATPAPAPANKDARVLKLSVTTPETSPTYDAAVEFGKILSEKSGGTLAVEVYANTVLAGGNQTKAIEMVQNGTIDIGWNSGIVQAALIPDLNITCIPWIWESNEMLDKALVNDSEVYKMYEQKFLEKDLVLLGFGENGFREITNSKKAIKTPADMKNLKFRVLGNNMLIDTFLALGANPTDVNFNELFTAMQQGAVDGQENPVSTIIVPQRYYECQKYMTVWKYSYDTVNMQMGKKVWDSFSADEQAIIREAAAEGAENQKKLARAGYEDDMKMLEEKGMEITILTDEEIQAFREIVRSVIDENSAKYDQDLLNAVLACK